MIQRLGAALRRRTVRWGILIGLALVILVFTPIVEILLGKLLSLVGVLLAIAILLFVIKAVLPRKLTK